MANNSLISDKMNAALNEQIGNEMSASMQYIAIAAYFDSEDLLELARHFYRQSEEERTHALRFLKFVVDAGASVEMGALPQPQNRFNLAEEAIQKALDGEITVTRQINALVDMATRENDHITHNFLQWFVTEQLEEVSSTSTLLKIVQRAGESNLLMVEEYLVRNGRLGAEPEASST
ncbi:MAG: ferritin [Armatimonadetes bacterium]|nr:ferritin [Armatimonadota bacterium]